MTVCHDRRRPPLPCPPNPQPGCVFCEHDKLPALLELRRVTVCRDQRTVWPEPYLVFTPLNPVVPGHLLVVPVEHVDSAAADPALMAGAAQIAAQIAAESQLQANIITSIGQHATQTVRHGHVHLVPRRASDRLQLPWGMNPTSHTPGECPHGSGVRGADEASTRTDRRPVQVG